MPWIENKITSISARAIRSTTISRSWVVLIDMTWGATHVRTFHVDLVAKRCTTKTQPNVKWMLANRKPPYPSSHLDVEDQASPQRCYNKEQRISSYQACWSVLPELRVGIQPQQESSKRICQTHWPYQSSSFVQTQSRRVCPLQQASWTPKVWTVFHIQEIMLLQLPKQQQESIQFLNKKPLDLFYFLLDTNKRLWAVCSDSRLRRSLALSPRTQNLWNVCSDSSLACLLINQPHYSSKCLYDDTTLFSSLFSTLSCGFSGFRGDYQAGCPLISQWMDKITMLTHALLEGVFNPTSLDISALWYNEICSFTRPHTWFRGQRYLESNTSRMFNLQFASGLDVCCNWELATRCQPGCRPIQSQTRKQASVNGRRKEKSKSKTRNWCGAKENRAWPSMRWRRR